MSSSGSSRKKVIYKDTFRGNNPASNGHGSKGITLSIASCWRDRKPARSNVECQTSPELFEFREAETQSGRCTDILQAQVHDADSGITLLEHFCRKQQQQQQWNKKQQQRSEAQWASSITSGAVTVDCEVVTDPAMVVQSEFFIEFVNNKVSVGTQTSAVTAAPAALVTAAAASASASAASRSSSGKRRSEGKQQSDEGDFEDEYNNNNSADDEQQSATTAAAAAIAADDPRLARFLRSAGPLMLRELSGAGRSQAFALLSAMTDSSSATAAAAGGESIAYFKLLSVDLEKQKVVYPDWSQARHFKGVVVGRTVTRNKERIYQIEYDDDGSVVSGVREEYIRLLGAPLQQSNSSTASTAAAMVGKKNKYTSAAAEGSIITPHFSLLQEGVRVHARVSTSRSNSSSSRFCPGRITRVVRSNSNSSSGGVYDVEIEGGRVECGLTAEDLVIGLSTGQVVEARRPSKVQLQCTGLSWNATGGFLAAAYGRSDLTGWCDYPGAVCCWGIFSKDFNPRIPDFVLDHTSCLMCVRYHPVKPSIVAAGSFNGEVILWDLTQPEQPLLVSAISEYAHKEPVLDVQWVQQQQSTTQQQQQQQQQEAISGDADDSWLLCSVGADGKVLFWHSKNKFEFPVKGNTLAQKNKSSARRHYPASHGATVAAFSSSSATATATSSTSTGNSSSGSSVLQNSWMLVGQEGGSITRAQVKRVLGGPLLTQSKFKNLPAVEDVFPSLRSFDSSSNNNSSSGVTSLAYQPHIGGVAGLSFSPFHKNLFLTCGADGLVKLFNLLEKQPKLQWEPRPPPGSAGVSGAFASLSAAQFSPARPLVFAAASSDGFVYLYDLLKATSSPAAVLQCLLNPPLSAAHGGGVGGVTITDTTASSSTTTAAGKQKKRTVAAATAGDSKTRVSVTGLAFNPKQRKFIAACDYLGRVHVWKLPGNLSSARSEEEALLRQLGGVGSSNAVATAAGLK